jgi:hypothetical protein
MQQRVTLDTPAGELVLEWDGAVTKASATLKGEEITRERAQDILRSMQRTAEAAGRG